MVGVFLLFVDAGGSHGCVVCRGRMGFNVLGAPTILCDCFDGFWLYFHESLLSFFSMRCLVAEKMFSQA